MATPFPCRHFHAFGHHLRLRCTTFSSRYYVCHETKETTWDDPRTFAPVVEKKKKKRKEEKKHHQEDHLMQQHVLQQQELRQQELHQMQQQQQKQLLLEQLQQQQELQLQQSLQKRQQTSYFNSNFSSSSSFVQGGGMGPGMGMGMGMGMDNNMMHPNQQQFGYSNNSFGQSSYGVGSTYGGGSTYNSSGDGMGAMKPNMVAGPQGFQHQLSLSGVVFVPSPCYGVQASMIVRRVKTQMSSLSELVHWETASS